MNFFYTLFGILLNTLLAVLIVFVLKSTILQWLPFPLLLAFAFCVGFFMSAKDPLNVVSYFKNMNKG